MTWYHDYDGGRAFYTNFGHTDETYSEPEFLKILRGGMAYAIGDNKPLDYTKATTVPYLKTIGLPKKFLTSIWMNPPKWPYLMTAG